MISIIALASKAEELVTKELGDDRVKHLHADTASAIQRGIPVRDIVWFVGRGEHTTTVSVDHFDETLLNKVDEFAPESLTEDAAFEAVAELPRSRPGEMLIVYVGPEGIFAQHAEP